MSDDTATLEDYDSTAAGETAPVPARKAPVSILAVATCVCIFLYLASRDQADSVESLASVGYLTAESVWDGGYWALVSSAFVHAALWHLAFNVYWLWFLGSRVERAIGSLPYLAFVIVAAFVSSSLQLALSGSTGIGASGVVYAIFGFMWAGRRRYPLFRASLEPKTIQLFIFWLFGCIIATYLGIWSVGNAAHVSGLLFGILAAGTFSLPEKRVQAAPGLAVLAAAAFVTLFWAPWSVEWLAHKAYRAQAAGRYEQAIGLYSRIIEKDDANAWAYRNRGLAYQAAGQNAAAEVDLYRADKLEDAGATAR